MYEFDTIAAISTPPGEGGIGIVRISGDRSLDIIKNIFIMGKGNKLEDIADRHFYYGKITDKNSNIIDEVLMVCMKAPRSYTKEDIVEIHCHGGIVPVRSILEAVIENAARLAEPGEFTKRAFLNGRLDLAQAEAVMDLISSKSDEAARASVLQMEGFLSEKIQSIRSRLLAIIAHIEASIDYPEDDIDDIVLDEIKTNVTQIKGDLDILIDSAIQGKLIRQGIKTVIIGKPNVGKSSLLNALLRENRAIVTEIPGTTRDIIEESINIKGVLVRIIDTAGIRQTSDVVEKIGVERSEKSIEYADLIILMFDASISLEQEDLFILDKIKHKKVLTLINKIDKPVMLDIDMIKSLLPGKTIIETSLVEGKGVDEIEKYIYDMVFSGAVTQSSDLLVTNVRHEQALKNAHSHLEDVLVAIDDNIPLDLISIDIRSAWDDLGFITGDTVSDDLLDEIFSKFCLGK